jgi:hypothetical protein
VKEIHVNLIKVNYSNQVFFFVHSDEFHSFYF